MEKPMFSKEGHFWISFINNRINGKWIEAANAKSAKAIFAIKEGVVMSSYIVSSKKGYTA
jgi:heptaprenylglyceryl phosphate synthase